MPEAEPPIPRFFAVRANAGPRPLSADMPLLHAVDAFRIAGRNAVAREWIVTLDAENGLRAYPDEVRNELPEPIPAELAWNEIAQPGRGLRTIDARRFYLFNVRLVEQPGDAPGLDDPVYLYGSMTGPWPSDAPRVADGQLTVSRGDLMQGLVGCATQAFRYAGSADGLGVPASACYHALLPGGREEDIAAGNDIVLAYIMPPPGMIAGGAGNDSVVAQTLYDLLKSFQDDLVRNDSRSPITRMLLPVPNRKYLEMQLQAQGYQIEGNKAVRRTAGSGFSGLLASVFGSDREALELAAEASLDELFRLSAQALGALPGWPTRRSVALGRRLTVAGAVSAPNAPRAPRGGEAPSRQSPASAPRVFRPTTPPPVPPVLTAGHQMGQRPADWVQDFIQAHRAPNAPPPRVTDTWQAPPRDWRR